LPSRSVEVAVFGASPSPSTTIETPGSGTLPLVIRPAIRHRTGCALGFVKGTGDWAPAAAPKAIDVAAPRSAAAARRTVLSEG
jgi:hypothetical protein